ncbi:MAG: hypothetical protein QM763_10865 [Agriterribacter sp.]
MVSEDFHYLVCDNKKAVYDFLFVGIANPEAVTKANKEGRQYPFFNHSNDFQADLSAIPLGTAIGSTALLGCSENRIDD